jgi:hypothetical protein
MRIKPMNQTEKHDQYHSRPVKQDVFSLDIYKQTACIQSLISSHRPRRSASEDPQRDKPN